MRKIQPENEMKEMSSGEEPKAIQLAALVQSSLQYRISKMLSVHPKFTEAVTSLQPVEQEKEFDTRSFRPLDSVLWEHGIIP